MYFWKSLELKAPEIKPSSTPRAAPIRPNEMTASHSLQLKTCLGSSRFFRRKMFTGFFGPPAMVGSNKVISVRIMSSPGKAQYHVGHNDMEESRPYLYRRLFSQMRGKVLWMLALVLSDHQSVTRILTKLFRTPDGSRIPWGTGIINGDK